MMGFRGGKTGFTVFVCETPFGWSLNIPRNLGEANCIYCTLSGYLPLPPGRCAKLSEFPKKEQESNPNIPI